MVSEILSESKNDSQGYVILSEAKNLLYKTFSLDGIIHAVNQSTVYALYYFKISWFVHFCSSRTLFLITVMMFKAIATYSSRP